MKFDFYDVFTKVIPGALLMLVLLQYNYISLSEQIPELAYLFLSYILGFFIDAVAAKERKNN